MISTRALPDAPIVAQVVVPVTRKRTLYPKAPVTGVQLTRALVAVMLSVRSPVGVLQGAGASVVNVWEALNALVLTVPAAEPQTV